MAAGLVVAFPTFLEIVPSPYKRISAMSLDPAARIVATRESPTSRLDLVEAPTIHSAPGLSLTYQRPLPLEAGLVIDGDTLLPVLDVRDAPSELADALPISVPLAARPGGRVLLLGSGGGMDAWAALTRGAREVTVVEPNALVLEALTGPLRARAGLADDSRVDLVHAEIRTFASQANADGPYDIVELVLADNYRPISAGAFTLSETYGLTVDAVRDYLRLIGPDGLLIITRWLQEPPSESARTVGIVLEALGDRPVRQHIVAFRSFQTVTLLVKGSPFSEAETDRLLAAIDARRYDVVLAPRIPPESVNRYAVLPEPTDHELALRLAGASDRRAVFASSALDIGPTTDDRPFFFQFFRWEQTPAVLEGLGRRWQPFGGSGYLVVVGPLGFALLATGLAILLPIALRRSLRAALAAAGASRSSRAVGYVTAIGLAFLFVEVALVGRLIVLLGTPTLAFAGVVGGLLFWSGLGSLVSARLPWRPAIVVLAAILAAVPAVIAAVGPPLLALPLALRVGGVLLLLAPIGLLMGVPFPRLVTALGGSPGLIPWAWAANGSASVVGGVAAPMLALSTGFGSVLGAAALLYLLAAVLTIGGPVGGPLTGTVTGGVGGPVTGPRASVARTRRTLVVSSSSRRPRG
jgi:spermidine synthase